MRTHLRVSANKSLPVLLARIVLALGLAGCGGSKGGSTATLGKPAHEGVLLILQMNGEEVRLPLDEMTYYHVKRGREEFPDGFAFSGPNVALAGLFWISFDEDQMEKLVNKPVTILREAGRPVERKSTIKLGEDVYSVTDGSFVTERVERINGITVLSGKISLELHGPEGKLTGSGTFRAPVEPVY